LKNFLLSTDTIDMDGIKCFLTAIVDITERRRSEDKLRVLSDELTQSNKELEEFAYAASHDLQEPLRSVTSYLQLLERRYTSSLNEEALEFIHRAVNGATRMHTLINDLLAYSRIGTRPVALEQVDCVEILETTLDNLYRSIKENKAQVKVESEMPVIQADRLQLTSLFQNLISNAIKFRTEKIPEIKIMAHPNKTHWHFSVSDNGIGIAKKDSQNIFNVFQRLHSRAEYPGTGIGLAICKKIVEHHGGKIWLDSEEGNGTTFHFTILK